jgi:hydrogenase maturation protein HypF
VVNLVKDLAKMVRQNYGIRTVALSGGVWQNMYLLKHVYRALSAENFDILYHRQVPTNDGGIALGQAMIAAMQIKKMTTQK